MQILFVCLILKFAIVTGGALTYKTFTARAIPLKSGQVIQTPTDWGPLPWPEGNVAIRHFSSNIVDENGTTVPLEELYVHHWLMYDGKNEQNGGFCMTLSNIFGAGAEIRGIQIDAPYPYGLVSKGDEEWTANLHFIRTSNVPQDTVQDCVECRCRSSNPPKHPHGSVGCCPDQSLCYGMENSTLDDSKDYYFQYTLGWEPMHDGIKPMKVYSTDITAHFNSDCLVEYDIPEVLPGEVNMHKTTYHIPSKFEVVYIETHQHIGGENMTIEHYRDGKSMGILCTSAPVYSAQHGYIEDIPPCHYPEPYTLLQGDQLHMTSLYTGRSIRGGHPWHSGVMSLAFIVAHADPFPKEICLKEFHQVCGEPPYSTLLSCAQCAAKHLQDLTTNYNCSLFAINNECDKNLGGGNIPMPDSVHDMIVSANSIHADFYEFNVTAPADRWFGIGLKPLTGTMDGAIAWIYSTDPDSGKKKLQRRMLGMHNAGKLINDDVLIKALKVVDNTIHMTFDSAVGDDLSIPGMCWLFAQGAKNAPTFAYHGSFRGATCLTV